MQSPPSRFLQTFQTVGVGPASALDRNSIQNNERRMMTTERERKDRSKSRLILPSGLEGAGFLIVPADGQSVIAEFTASRIELILVLNDKRSADVDLPELARGWLAPDQITALFRYPIEEGSLRRAISKINRTFREAATLASEIAPPPLIENKRKIGFRLSWPLDITMPDTDGMR